jgi:hypothetical protein
MRLLLLPELVERLRPRHGGDFLWGKKRAQCNAYLGKCKPNPRQARGLRPHVKEPNGEPPRSDRPDLDIQALLCGNGSDLGSDKRTERYRDNNGGSGHDPDPPPRSWRQTGDTTKVLAPRAQAGSLTTPSDRAARRGNRDGSTSKPQKTKRQRARAQKRSSPVSSSGVFIRHPIIRTG